MNIDVGTIESTLGIVTTVVSGLIAFGAAWWRFSRWVHSLEADREKSSGEIGKLIASHVKLTESITILSVKLEEREKDTMKLEGAIDAQRKDMVSVITSLQRTSSSLDALWRTMQNLYSDKVPRRISDKG
jgi:seryl-tRNA synthetase